MSADLQDALKAMRSFKSGSKSQKIVDSFDWESYHADLTSIYADAYGAIVTDQGNDTADTLGISFDYEDPFVQKELTRYIGEAIVSLDGTTKDDVSRIISDALDGEGAGTVNELGDLISESLQEKFDGYEDWRADRIARTETATAYNFGTIFAAKQGGISEVEVSDGDDDDDCSEADGQVWTLEEALAEPVAHPNCTRAFSPVVDDGTEDDEGGDGE